ncbi:MAG: CDP-archaeol synthase [Thermoanaerobaculia bacterium]
MRDIFEAVYIFLPAGVANATPPLLTKLFGLGRPIDGGRTWRGKPIFGSHKTWLGLIGGTAAGVLVFALQRHFDSIALPLAAGVAMSFGALAGDVSKSFLKRRFAVAPGRSWFPLDQLDYIFGALIATMPFFQPSLLAAIGTIVVYFAAHLVVSAIGFLLRVKDSPL